MKLSRSLVATLILLAAAGTSHALSPRIVAQSVARMAGGDPDTKASRANVNFVGFAVNPFAAVATEEPAGEEESAAPVRPSAAPRPEGGEAWQNELVTEGLKTWQVLCKKGRLGEAEQLAAMLASLQPDNPKVRAACTVTQFFKSLAARMTPDVTCPDVAWQGPLPGGCALPTFTCPEQLPMPTCVGAPCAGRTCCQGSAGTCCQAAAKAGTCCSNTTCNTCPAESCCAQACCAARAAAAKACKCCKECTSCSCCDKPGAQQTVQAHVIELVMPHPPLPMAPMHMPIHPGMMPAPHVVSCRRPTWRRRT